MSATWFASGNRATDAPYPISDGGASPVTVDVNQESAPNDFSDAGVSWEDLVGTYNVTGTSLVVRLTHDANEYVVADAVRVERVGDLPAAVVAAKLPYDVDSEFATFDTLTLHSQAGLNRGVRWYFFSHSWTRIISPSRYFDPPAFLIAGWLLGFSTRADWNICDMGVRRT